MDLSLRPREDQHRYGHDHNQLSVASVRSSIYRTGNAASNLENLTSLLIHHLSSIERPLAPSVRCMSPQHLGKPPAALHCPCARG